jgi:hypothetical protein
MNSAGNSGNVLMVIVRLAATIMAVCFVVPAAAEDALPRNTIDCRAFVKDENGHWLPREVTTFDIGDVTSLSVGPVPIGPGALHVGGADLYEVLEKKCASK